MESMYTVRSRYACNCGVKEVLENFTQLPACEICMEAGSSRHYWARRLQGLGHRVKLMAPQFVRPYVKTHKNDMRDADLRSGDPADHAVCADQDCRAIDYPLAQEQ